MSFLSSPAFAVLVALSGAYGTFLLYSALAFGWRGVGLGPRFRRASRASVRERLARLGLEGIGLAQLGAGMAVLGLVGAGLAFALFGGAAAAALAGIFAAGVPVSTARARRQRRREVARQAWPAMLEEMRLLTGSLGRSIPQALFESARNGPRELRGAFAAAEREWLVSTDFSRTIATLESDLRDPTADAALETLLVAQELGGTGLEERLNALVADRRADLEARKDALAEQAGVRFARRFVVIVPVGMALAGLSIGTGRAAYATFTGQAAMLAAASVLVMCWLWAGRLLRLPEARRVFEAGEDRR